jgi:single-strand DNA-binding protein
MNETHVTIAGRLVADPMVRNTGSGQPFTTFRVASTVRRWNAKTNEFEDANTNFVNVTAWRSLGANIAGSLHRGDPVVVTGRLKVAQWTRKLGEHEVGVTSVDIDANAVGHDLTWGTTRYTKVSRASFSTGDDRMDDPAVQEARAELEGYGPEPGDNGAYDVVDPVTGELHRFGGAGGDGNADNDDSSESARENEPAEVTPLRAGV